MLKVKTNAIFSKGFRTYFDDINYTDDEERAFKDILGIKEDVKDTEIIRITITREDE